MSRSITDITGAIDVKRHRRQRRRRIVVVTAVAIVVLVAVAVVVVRHSGVFAVEHVDVTGVRMLKADQVRDAARISPGTPLARVDVDHAASSVVAMPDVADVTVSRHWPRTVQIAVTERRPVYQVSGHGGFTWVDEHGQMFHQSATRSSQLLVVRLDASKPRMRTDAATVASSLSKEIRAQTDHIEVRGTDSIQIHLAKGGTIVWGSADESALKSKVATAMLNVKAKEYDVSSPQRPTSR